MPAIKLKSTKAGVEYYEIRVSLGRGKSQPTTRWYPPEGWSKRAIDRELTKVAADFERRCKEGEILSRKDAKEKAIQEAQEAAKILTLRRYGETVFMPSKGITMSEKTRSDYDWYLKKHIYPALGYLKMPDISSANITAFLLSMQAAGLAHTTVIKGYAILRSLFKMAYMADVVPRNPMDKVERPRPRKDEIKASKMEAFTADELRYILECLDKEPLKWRALVRLLVDTGFRRGECCGLRWSCVDFENNSIQISGNLCYTPERGVYLDTPKNSCIRTIGVDPEVMQLLRNLKECSSSEWVFTQNESTEPMNPQSPTRYLARFAKKYGVENLHPHKLRHSFASVAITNGADIASVSEKLGHSDKAVTLRMYTHADRESIDRASNIFRSALRQKPNSDGTQTDT